MLNAKTRNFLRYKNFNRLRIGIDRDDKEIVDYVLSKLTKEQAKQLDDILIITNNILDDFVAGQTYNQIMNTYNSKK